MDVMMERFVCTSEGILIFDYFEERRSSCVSWAGLGLPSRWDCRCGAAAEEITHVPVTKY